MSARPPAPAVSRDRLQPALLDRLVDDEPSNPHEDAERRTITKSRLRQSVLRDLSWLLNAQAGSFTHLDADAFRHVFDSTLNYGVPPLSGQLVSKVEPLDLQRLLREAIIRFEPRILPDSLQVRAVRSAKAGEEHNVLTFEVTGQLWAQPYPLELLLKTDVDFETGMVAVRDRDGTVVSSERRVVAGAAPASDAGEG